MIVSHVDAWAPCFMPRKNKDTLQLIGSNLLRIFFYFYQFLLPIITSIQLNITSHPYRGCSSCLALSMKRSTEVDPLSHHCVRDIWSNWLSFFPWHFGQIPMLGWPLYLLAIALAPGVPANSRLHYDFVVLTDFAHYSVSSET